MLTRREAAVVAVLAHAPSGLSVSKVRNAGDAASAEADLMRDAADHTLAERLSDTVGTRIRPTFRITSGAWSALLLGG